MFGEGRVGTELTSKSTLVPCHSACFPDEAPPRPPGRAVFMLRHKPSVLSRGAGLPFTHREWQDFTLVRTHLINTSLLVYSRDKDMSPYIRVPIHTPILEKDSEPASRGILGL